MDISALCILAAPVLGGNSGTWGGQRGAAGAEVWGPKGQKSRPKAEAGVGFLGRGG